MNAEYLDYCRVKKIFEKGFGFLTSLYYEENVFFHFSKIKDPAVKEKLEKLKRGEVYLFYTSKSVKGKRRVDKIWIDIKDIDKTLIPPFTIRIIEELGESKINIFELAHVVLLLSEAGHINKNQFERILNTGRVKRFPSSIIKMLSPNEVEMFDDLEKSIDEAGTSETSYAELTQLVLKKIF
ncbi:cold shock domain-containing protein [Bacteroidota bacterium]